VGASDGIAASKVERTTTAATVEMNFTEVCRSFPEADGIGTHLFASLCLLRAQFHSPQKDRSATFA
jgi:hypothetical protein